MVRFDRDCRLDALHGVPERRYDGDANGREYAALFTFVRTVGLRVRVEQRFEHPRLAAPEVLVECGRANSERIGDLFGGRVTRPSEVPASIRGFEYLELTVGQ